MSFPPIITQYNPTQPYKLSNAQGNFFSPFAPTQVSNLALWLDSADTATFGYSTGSNITRLDDKSPNSNFAQPLAASNSPVNTASGVLFSNTNSGAGGTIQGLTTPYTGNTIESVFIVLNPDNGAGNYSLIYGNKLDARQIWIDNTSNIITGSNDLSTRLAAIGLLEKDVIQFVDVLFNEGTQLKQYVNGLNTATLTSFTRFTQTSNTTIGTDNYIGSNGYCGYINEILIYSNYLSDSERQKVESYLAYKWGTALDPSNPYNLVPNSNYLYPSINSNSLLSNATINNTAPINSSSYPLVSNYFATPYVLKNIKF